MKPAFFMHIPKTGGTSVHCALEPHYGPCLFYPPLASDGQNQKLGKKLNGFLNRIDVATVSERDQLTDLLCAQPFIGGHTDARLLPFLGGSRFVFTCLRDPVDRLVSYYFHVTHPEKPSWKREYGAQTAGMDFFEFLHFSPLHTKIDNLMTRFLSGEMRINSIGDDQLEKALKALDFFNYICFQAELAEGFANVTRALGLGELTIASHKVGESRKQIAIASPYRYNNRVEPYVRYDYALVEIVRKKFQIQR
ncbi:MAG: sulfotransferase family 2 domain-containing protein [Cyanobacteria bacterium J06638_22]